MVVAETSIVKKNHQIPCIINQNIAQRLSILTSTIIRKLNDFRFKHDFSRLPETIRNHFLKYDRVVRCRVKIMTMDMFSSYYDLAKQLFPHAKIVLDYFHPSLLYF